MAALLSVKSLFSQVSCLATKSTGGNGKYAKVITTLSVPVTILLEYGLENVFVCPQEKYFEYSLMFLLGPCVPLFFIMLMITDEFNRTLAGFCGYWRIYGFRKKRYRGRCKHFCKHLTICLLKCTLAPATWFILVLLKKDVYACGIVGVVQTHDNGDITYQTMKSEAERESQMLGLIILICAVTVAALAFICKQCCIIDRKEAEGIELEPLDKYKAYEADCARDQFEEILKKAAKVNSIKKLNFLLNNSLETQVEVVKSTAQTDIPFEQIMEARERLLEVYPRLCNPLDSSLEWYEHCTWLAIAENHGKEKDIKFGEAQKRCFSENEKASGHKNNKVSPEGEGFSFKEFNFNRFLPDNNNGHVKPLSSIQDERKSKRKNQYDMY